MKSRTSRIWIAGLCAVIVIGTCPISGWAAQGRVSPGAMGMDKENNTKKEDPIMQAGILFTATLESAVAGPVAQSYPPIYTHKLKLTVKEVFRGELTEGQTLTANHQARQHKAPKFPVNKLCVVAVSDVREHFVVDHIQEATEALTNKARMAAKLPLGWKITQDRPVSPWATMGKKFWPGTLRYTPDQLVCSKSGRPALFAAQGIEFSVEPVPPVEKIKWTNPDGDGLYKLTVTNTSNQPREVAALLTDGGTILWNESVAIVCQKKAQPPALCAKRIPKTVKSVTLEPGQSVSGEVNAFGIKGIEWPRGGYRVEFLFCLGEKSVKQSFYYMSKHHDNIREQAETQQPDDQDDNTTSPDASSADYLLNIRFLSETPIELAPNASVKVDVWGHDKLVADVRATLIKTVVAPLKNLSDAVVVPFSKEDLATVKPQSGHKNSLGYYFRFTMDTNGDGQSGPGDYGWDFIKTDMMFFDENQTGEQDIQIHLKKKLM